MKTNQLTDRRSRLPWLTWVPVSAMFLMAAPGLTSEARAQDGLLDLNFGRPGVFTPIGPKGSAIHFMRVLPDGRILAVGQETEDGNDTHAALARYNADGSLDATFSDRGVVKTPFDGHAESAQSFDVQPDGKIVVLVNTLRGATNGTHAQALARYRADGSLDATFGQGGLKRTFPHGSYAWPGGEGLAIQPDGKIVAAVLGAENTERGAGSRLRVMRLSPDGSPDPSFNHGTVTNVAMPAAMAVLSGLAIQPDGKIILSAVAPPGADDPYDRADVRLTRLNADGTLDQAFGHEGGFLVVDVAFPGRNRAAALAVQDDGKILVALSVNLPEPSQPVSALLRYMPDGLVDFAFGNHGAVVASHTDPSRQPYASKPHAIALQPDGKILLGGASVQPGAPLGAMYEFSLLRFENRSAAPAARATAGTTRRTTDAGRGSRTDRRTGA